MTGRLITFEGPDGSGKSTNIPILEHALRCRGFDVVTTREPGGTPLSEKIRGLLLHDSMCTTTELLMFAAARAEHLKLVVLPAILAGKIVLCDRFTDSTYAYQGSARGQRERVLELERFVCDGFEPDYTLFFDITLEESLARLSARGAQDRFDGAALEFKKLVYEGYLERFRDHRHRMHRIDAMPRRSVVSTSVLEWLDHVFLPQNIK